MTPQLGLFLTAVVVISTAACSGDSGSIRTALSMACAKDVVDRHPERYFDRDAANTTCTFDTTFKSLARPSVPMLSGFAVNAITGASIFMKDAASYGINLDLYVKLLFVLAGMAFPACNLS